MSTHLLVSMVMQKDGLASHSHVKTIRSLVWGWENLDGIGISDLAAAQVLERYAEVEVTALEEGFRILQWVFLTLHKVDQRCQIILVANY